VDVGVGRLLDVVPGRSAVEPCRWLHARGEEWRERIAWATLDLSGPYRSVFDTMLPDATQIADPFHLVKVRHEAHVTGWVARTHLRAVAAAR
jgi:transposase